jgi:hypothetical protein
MFKMKNIEKVGGLFNICGEISILFLKTKPRNALLGT